MKNDKSAAHILIVDDQPDMLHMMKLILSRCGYQVETACSAFEALHVARDFCPHVVISDIAMPGMDGCEMMSLLRRQSGSRAFKAIALTGYGLPCDQARIVESGFDLCLLKPLDFPILVDHIEQMLESRAASQIDAFPLPHVSAENPKPMFCPTLSKDDYEPRQMAAEH